MHTIQNFEIVFLREKLPSMALRNLAYNPVAFVLISTFAFSCRVSHTTMVSGDEKSLASKLIWIGKSWPKVAVGGKAMISCVFEVKVPWFSGCYSGLLHLIIVVQASFTNFFALHRLTIKAFQGHLN